MTESKIELYLRKQGDNLIWSNKAALKKWIRNLPEGEDVLVTYTSSKDLKTLAQLRMIYRSFRLISSYTGQPLTDVKLMMKLRSGHCFTHNIEGREITECKSLSDFTKTEISDFIQFINNWCLQTLEFATLTEEDINFLRDLNN